MIGHNGLRVGGRRAKDERDPKGYGRVLDGIRELLEMAGQGTSVMVRKVLDVVFCGEYMRCT